MYRPSGWSVLRHDTLRIIDGAGPSVDADQTSGAKPEQTSETQVEQVSSPNEEQKLPPICPTEQVAQARSREKAVSQPDTSIKCTFFGVVPIDITRFLESGVAVVECPGCACTRTLEPHGGSCGSSRTTNAKRTLPILENDGPGGKRTGMLSEERASEAWVCMAHYPKKKRRRAGLLDNVQALPCLLA